MLNPGNSLGHPPLHLSLSFLLVALSHTSGSPLDFEPNPLPLIVTLAL